MSKPFNGGRSWRGIVPKGQPRVTFSCQEDCYRSHMILFGGWGVVWVAQDKPYVGLTGGQGGTFVAACTSNTFELCSFIFVQLPLNCFIKE